MTIKNQVKDSRLYKELRLFYRAAFGYRRGPTYLYHRLIATRLAKRNTAERSTDIDPDYSVHFLCSHDDLALVYWALTSWYRVVPRSGQVYIHEDGSFSANDKKVLSRIFPNARIIDKSWASSIAREQWLSRLPQTLKYRERAVADRRHNFAIKLIDPYFVSQASSRLILDTDVLWFAEPREILSMLKSGSATFAMNGGFPMDFVFADGASLSSPSSSLNSGIVGYIPSKHFLLGKLEEYCSRLGDNANPHFIEQAGYAYLLATQSDFRFLDTERYTFKRPLGGTIVAKHYTGPRREQFWFEGVKWIYRHARAH